MITSIVLSGGKGSRLGGMEKGLIDYHGHTLIERKTAQLLAFSDDILVITNQLDKYPMLPASVRIFSDVYPYGGPLQGFYSGLVQARYDTVFLTAVDMPYFSFALFHELCTLLDETTDAVVPHAHGYWQPLFAVYKTHIVHTMQSYISRDYSLKRFIATLRVRKVSENALDPYLTRKENDPFANINTKDMLSVLLPAHNHK